MRVYSGSEAVGGATAGCAVVIGNLDGVHIGHQALFARARELAGDAPVVALTFDPHPARFFRPELAPPLIATPAQKRELLASVGADAMVVQRFDADFAALTAADFARVVLAERLGAGHVVVGETFAFGKGRAGDLAALQRLGVELGFGAHGVAPVQLESIVVSSSKVREFVMLGRVEGARALLGRPFTVIGPVVTGDGRGSTIGVPTANLDCENELDPGRGVYAGHVTRADGSRYQAVVNVGIAPTIKNKDVVTVEAHLLDMRADMLSERLSLTFEHRLRDEQRFSSIDALVKQIHADIARARELLGGAEAGGETTTRSGA